ncbi:MAG: SprT family zinc-dependent metalloprotease [Pseudomonadota bacterium]
MDGGAWQDGLPVDLVIRRSARARRISLRVSRRDGRVSLTVPLGVPEAEALAFARSKADWIAGHQAARPADIVVQPGATLPILGQPHVIETGPGRRVTLARGVLYVPPGPVGPRIAAFLKAQARDVLAEASDRYAAALGKPYAQIALRDTRSRWGSCSSQGRLMYSWRLIMAPRPVLDYVAAHEVAHLAHMDHSRAFWATVERLYGPYDAPRRWLRDEGGALHRYIF